MICSCFIDIRFTSDKELHNKQYHQITKVKYQTNKENLVSHKYLSEAFKN